VVQDVIDGNNRKRESRKRLEEKGQRSSRSMTKLNFKTNDNDIDISSDRDPKRQQRKRTNSTPGLRLQSPTNEQQRNNTRGQIDSDNCDIAQQYANKLRKNNGQKNSAGKILTKGEQNYGSKNHRDVHKSSVKHSYDGGKSNSNVDDDFEKGYGEKKRLIQCGATSSVLSDSEGGWTDSQSFIAGKIYRDKCADLEQVSYIDFDAASFATTDYSLALAAGSQDNAASRSERKRENKINQKKDSHGQRTTIEDSQKISIDEILRKGSKDIERGVHKSSKIAAISSGAERKQKMMKQPPPPVALKPSSRKSTPDNGLAEALVPSRSAECLQEIPDHSMITVTKDNGGQGGLNVNRAAAMKVHTSLQQTSNTIDIHCGDQRITISVDPSAGSVGTRRVLDAALPQQQQALVTQQVPTFQEYPPPSVSKKQAKTSSMTTAEGQAEGADKSGQKKKKRKKRLVALEKEQFCEKNETTDDLSESYSEGNYVSAFSREYGHVGTFSSAGGHADTISSTDFD